MPPSSGPAPSDLLLRPGQIDFGRVRDQDDDRLAGDPSPRGLVMRLEDVVEADLVVVEEAIGGRHLGPAAAGGRDAGRGPRRQLRQMTSRNRSFSRLSLRSTVLISSTTQGASIGHSFDHSSFLRPLPGRNHRNPAQTANAKTKMCGTTSRERRAYDR